MNPNMLAVAFFVGCALGDLRAFMAPFPDPQWHLIAACAFGCLAGLLYLAGQP